MRRYIGRRLVVTVLAATIVVSLVACKSTGKKKTYNNETKAEETSASVEESKTAKVTEDSQKTKSESEAQSKVLTAQSEAKSTIEALTHIDKNAYLEKLAVAKTESDIAAVVAEAKKSEEALVAEEASKAEEARKAEEASKAEQAAKEAAKAEEARRQAEEEARRQAEEEARRQAEEEARKQAESESSGGGGNSGGGGSQSVASEARQMALEAFEIQNQYRASVGVAPLVWNEELYQNALVRANEIVGYFSHQRPDGSGFETAITLNWMGCAENIAAGQGNATYVMYSWTNSSGHCANLSNGSYNYGAIACVIDTNSTYGYYWVAEFITG